jgi:hypothetical protein
MKKIILTNLIFLISVFSFGQGISMEETIKYINSKYPQKFQVSLDKNMQLKFDFYASGSVNRTDEVYLFVLNPDKIDYSKEEEAIILRCQTDLQGKWKKFNDGCFMRSFLESGKRSYYNRLPIFLPYKEKETEGLMKAFKHLIRLAQDNGDYPGVEKFE